MSKKQIIPLPDLGLYLKYTKGLKEDEIIEFNEIEITQIDKITPDLYTTYTTLFFDNTKIHGIF